MGDTGVTPPQRRPDERSSSQWNQSGLTCCDVAGLASEYLDDCLPMLKKSASAFILLPVPIAEPT